MSEEIKVLAKQRNEHGTRAVRRLRHAGWLPGIIYSDGEQGEMIQFNEHDFGQLLRRHTSEKLIIDLEVEGAKAKKVLLKDVQHHAVTGKAIHADFHEISLTRKIRVTVGVELVGSAAGVLKQGGVLEHLLREVDLECLPTDLIETVEVDVSDLAIGDSLLVGDIRLDAAKFTIMTAPDVAIASVSAPRVEAQTAEEEAEGEQAAASGAPEVIGAKREEDEAGRGEG